MLGHLFRASKSSSVGTQVSSGIFEDLLIFVENFKFTCGLFISQFEDDNLYHSLQKESHF